ncbi:MAG: DUF523 domain-containing protein [Alphaproteobacteria bacterium]|nr:DUF523 domain-containing protein [Alphaproteobacteria bacterium]MCB9696029.1 DUF523 domain-containing protein [Alphaproteobacteria bacterium]
MTGTAGRLPHDPEALAALRIPTEDDPWRVLLSGCMAGWPCGVDGTSYGMEGAAGWLATCPRIRRVPFCPEDVGLGTPRTMPDLHGGDGGDVLDGRARVLDEHGVDLTEGMIRGARAMVEHALAQRVELAVLTDMSAACGSQVISDGCRFDSPRRFQRGVGVATAALLRAGVCVVSQRDRATLERLRERAEPGYVAEVDALDWHRQPWYLQTFG